MGTSTIRCVPPENPGNQLSHRTARMFGHRPGKASRMPGAEELPSTLERSPAKAQRTWIKAHDSAVKEYGEGERAHRTAFAALKQGWEKVGNRWVAKDHKGPSDPHPKGHTPKARRSDPTYGGVDVEGHTRDELYTRAQHLNIKGRSTMSKTQLAKAIARQQD